MENLFNYDFYINYYKDIKNYKYIDACNNFLNYGIKEKRIFNEKLINFDYDFYINYYSDLKNSNYLNACLHFLYYGIKENRISNYYNTNIIFNNMNKINENNNYLDNYLDNYLVLFHIYSIDIFKKILNDYPIIKKLKVICSITDEKNIVIIKKYINPDKIILVENKGMDIGGTFHILNYIKNVNKYRNLYYIKIHTKTKQPFQNKI